MMQPVLMLALAFAAGACVALLAALAVILILAAVALVTGHIVEPFE
jgi:hypothetical protein